MSTKRNASQPGNPPADELRVLMQIGAEWVEQSTSAAGPVVPRGGWAELERRLGHPFPPCRRRRFRTGVQRAVAIKATLVTSERLLVAAGKLLGEFEQS